MKQTADTHIPVAIRSSLDSQITALLQKMPQFAAQLDAEAVSAMTTDLRVRWLEQH